MDQNAGVRHTWAIADPYSIGMTLGFPHFRAKQTHLPSVNSNSFIPHIGPTDPSSIRQQYLLVPHNWVKAYLCYIGISAYWDSHIFRAQLPIPLHCTPISWGASHPGHSGPPLHRHNRILAFPHIKRTPDPHSGVPSTWTTVDLSYTRGALP